MGKLRNLRAFLAFHERLIPAPMSQALYRCVTCPTVTAFAPDRQDFFFHALPCMVKHSADDVASLVLSTYASLSFKPPSGQFTILAGFALTDGEAFKVISLGTGSKCLPAARLPKTGEALHDSHAEVLARRGAIRWFLDEIGRCCIAQGPMSQWILQSANGKFSLRDNVQLNMYISTVPCQ